MKRFLILLFSIAFFSLHAQNDPVLSIDGVNTTFKSGLSLPYWLKAGQTLDIVSNVKSVSILEFSADTINLKYSQVISLTSLQTVPVGKVWKIEGLGMGIIGSTIGGFSTSSAPLIFTSPKIFTTSNTYDWIVPPGITKICIEVWGGGGNGVYGNAGGGGGYGYECFTVVSGTHYTVVVGNVGYNSNIQNSGTSSVGSLISASGGTSTAPYNINGSSGRSLYNNGGSSIGGNSNSNEIGYGEFNNNAFSGQVIIYW